MNGVDVRVQDGFGNAVVPTMWSGLADNFLNFQACAQGNQFFRRLSFLGGQEESDFSRGVPSRYAAGHHTERHGKDHARKDRA